MTGDCVECPAADSVPLPGFFLPGFRHPGGDMGLQKSSLDAFRGRVEATLGELFPAVIFIAGRVMPATTVGGREQTRWEDAGEATNFRITFRVSKLDLPGEPRVGQPVEWRDGQQQRALEIAETSVRPAESHHTITCIRRRK